MTVPEARRCCLSHLRGLIRDAGYVEAVDWDFYRWVDFLRLDEVGLSNLRGSPNIVFYGNSDRKEIK